MIPSTTCRTVRFLLLSGILAVFPLQAASEADLRKALRVTSGVVQLPRGVIEITAALEIPKEAHDLKIVGDPGGTVVRAAASFRGDAILVFRSGARIALADFTIDGNRAALERRLGLPPSDVPFVRFYANNGILAENVADFTISDLNLRQVANFAILIAQSRQVRIQRVHIEASGSRNPKGRNNTSGGILLEEGTTDFQVEDCRIRNVRGNGVWTHSMYPSPRNRQGRIVGNVFENLARDAIQIGHATDVVVSRNSGRRIGYPVEEVDVEGSGIPIAIDTAGNVDRTVYAENRFEEINGQCINLDGFHHGEVRGNLCVNRGTPEAYAFGNYGIAMNNANPDMRSEFIAVLDNTIEGALYGGIFVIGSHHVIRNNRLRNLNLARCNQNRDRCTYGTEKDPDFLRSGIYLARGAERPDPAQENRIEENEISGYNMRDYCVVAAPGVLRDSNQIRSNRCVNQDSDK